MRYSADLRRRVIEFVKSGGRKGDAARIFNVDRKTVYNWLKAGEDAAPRKPGPKAPRKINLLALQEDVKAHPDAYHAERAARLGVKKSSVGRWLGIMSLSRKKNVATS